jgi:acyl carrier protein
MSPFTLEDLQEMIVDRLGIPAEEVADYDLDAPFHDLGLDSLAVVEVQLAIEQRYDFKTDEADADQIETLRGALAYVNERIGAGSAIS